MASLDSRIGAESGGDTASRSLGDLELELVRLRSEARAAHLEARAAEIELQVRQLRNAGETVDGIPRPTVAPVENSPKETTLTNAAAGCQPAARLAGKPPATPPFASGWEELATAAKQRQAASASSSAARSMDPSSPRTPHTPSRQASASPTGRDSSRSVDNPNGHDHATSRVQAKGREKPKRSEKGKGGKRTRERQVDATRRTADRKPDNEPPASPSLRKLSAPLQAQRVSPPPALPNQGLGSPNGQPPVVERRRPAAWLLSTLVHILVLLLLAGFTLSTPAPQDQLSFSASASREAAEELESLTIETMESAEEPSEQMPTDEAVEIDPLGDSEAVPPVSVEPPSASAPAEAMTLSDSIDTAELLPPSDSEMATEFCGVAGGGNHFCYIVDSSQSMKNGRFDSARAKLLQSIAQLKEDQRFYVIFYDTNVDRMCLTDPAQPEPHSVNATVENKRALRRWAMQIGLERGAPPDEALEFAFTLRPDVIFLLSDGEFPQRIEDLVAELNRNENLFGDQGPRSILHTIGYQSRDGETRMRRLAEANGGQYHYVPKP